MPPNPRLPEDQRIRVIEALKPFNPAVIYLFGSFGTDYQHPASDIDIAFFPTLATDPVDCFRIANQLADQLGHCVDLADLTMASTVFSKEVLRTGIPLEIQKPHIQQQFEMLTLADYARLNEERQPVLAP
jgi:predicted nucleotidyltransferase